MILHNELYKIKACSGSTFRIIEIPETGEVLTYGVHHWRYHWVSCSVSALQVTGGPIAGEILDLWLEHWVHHRVHGKVHSEVQHLVSQEGWIHFIVLS